MFKQLLLSLTLAGSLLVIFGSASFSQDTSERRIRKSQAAEKSQRNRSKAARRVVRTPVSGIPSCYDVYWLDSLCQLNGRVCNVHESGLSCE